MPVTSSDLWKLLRQSRLLADEQLVQVHAALERDGFGTAQTPADTLARQLIRRQILTPYQAKLLLNGRAGPFRYGEYLLQQRLSTGRLRGAFRAIHQPSRFPVQLKFAPQQVVRDQRQWNAARRFVHSECSVVSDQLQRVYSLEEHAGYRFLILEPLSGLSAAEQLVAGKLTAMESCRVVRLVALGLATLHQQRQVYGNVEPNHIWLESSGHVKLLRDRFLPPTVPAPWQAEQSEDVALPVVFLAPELNHPGTPLSSATDTYALGQTWCQLLASSPSGRAADEPLSWADSLPAELGQLLEAMVADDPQVRPRDLIDVAQKIQPYLSAVGQEIPEAVPSAAQLTFERSLGRTSEPSPVAPPPLLPEELDQPPSALLPAQAVQDPRHDPNPVAVFEAKQAANVTPQISTELEVVTPARSGRHRRRARHRRRDKGRRQALIWCVCAAASVLLAVGAGVMSSRLAKSPAVVPQPVTDRSITQRADEVGISGQEDKTGDPTSSAQWNKYEIRPDDGTLLWMSPTEGDGPKLKHVAPGALLIVLIRPAQLLESEYGQQVVQALGPTWKTTRQTLEALLGHALTEIDQLVVCQCPSDSEPNVSLHVRLLEQRSIDQLFERWNEPAPLKYRDVDYFGNGDWYYWIPGESPGNEFVVGQQAMVQELIDQGDSPPLVRRELRQLLQQSDADRHMTLVVAPDFVNPSALLNSNGIQKWRDLLVWLAGDQSKAISIGMQFGDPFYGELRARGETNGDGPELAVKLRTRMTELPEKIEERLAQVYPSQYWRRIALRFPEMLRYLERFTRSGVEDGQAVLNVVLPGQAAHNIAFAAEMLWDSADSGPPTDAVNKRDSERPSPENLDQLLSRRMDLSFGQKSLEFAIAELTEDIRETFSGLSFPVEIQIVGSDLQLSGITRNQQISKFEAQGLTIAEILTAIVVRANPVAGITDPADVDQKLIWVVAPHPDDREGHILLITTRDAALANGYKLPEPFQTK